LLLRHASRADVSRKRFERGYCGLWRIKCHQRPETN
jgi:hypothetical protein